MYLNDIAKTICMREKWCILINISLMHYLTNLLGHPLARSIQILGICIMLVCLICPHRKINLMWDIFLHLVARSYLRHGFLLEWDRCLTYKKNLWGPWFACKCCKLQDLNDSIVHQQLTKPVSSPKYISYVVRNLPISGFFFEEISFGAKMVIIT
jgi:hypothetical protein